MPVVNVSYDLNARTVVITAEFAAPVERVWQVYADPRQLAQVWGPPELPATVVEHDLRPGGQVQYFMTSADGQRFYGWWRVTTVDEPHGFSFEDNFAADDTFAPVDDQPTSKNVYAFEAHDGGTRATFTSTYSSPEALQQAIDIGVVEGTAAAIDQIDALVSA